MSEKPKVARNPLETPGVSDPEIGLRRKRQRISESGPKNWPDGRPVVLGPVEPDGRRQRLVACPGAGPDGPFCVYPGRDGYGNELPPDPATFSPPSTWVWRMFF